ncbi:MAG: nicotinate phosphoribosyltransferase [Pirellulaceae bacterium]|nr:MAG: nicotinate phosphoribosyltransferase [Pirellulaceae bacterium]
MCAESLQFGASSALLTDLYQLTMLQSYYRHGMLQTAVFEFFVRRLPANRPFLVAAGLEHLLDYLEELRFDTEELQWLSKQPQFHADFIDWLSEFRFTGDVWAVPEGTVVFAEEPLVRVVAPLPEAQLVESRLINLIQFPTLIATKAARCRLAAPGKVLVDFGFRRAHGAEAGLLAARAAYIAGFQGTATVEAGRLYGIPIYGTMAHSFIQAHPDEMLAFRNFATSNPGPVVLLLDTYDTEQAAEKVIHLAKELAVQGISVHGVRIDSGDLLDHARRVRKILDDGGLQQTRIFASGSLDEYALSELEKNRAPIDGYGIGSRLDTSADLPYLDCAYKLQEYAGRPCRKRSEGKATWPGRKQIFRRFQNGLLAGDSISLEDAPQPGQPLLELVMRGGRRTRPPVPLAELRESAARNLAQLPPAFCQLETDQRYPVEISEAIRNLAQQCDQQTLAGQSGMR